MTYQKRYSKGVQLRAVEDTNSDALPVLTGYGTVYDQVETIRGWFGDSQEVMRKSVGDSVLAKVARGEVIKLLSQHDTARPIGTTARGVDQVGGAKFFSDDHGLGNTVWPINSTAGRDTVEEVRSGVVDGMSIGFYITKQVWTESRDTDVDDLCEIMEIDLIESSFVTFPAYPGTSASLKSALRSFQPEEDIEQYHVLGKILSRHGRGASTSSEREEGRRLLKNLCNFLEEKSHIDKGEEGKNDRSQELVKPNYALFRAQLDLKLIQMAQ